MLPRCAKYNIKLSWARIIYKSESRRLDFLHAPKSMQHDDSMPVSGATVKLAALGCIFYVPPILCGVLSRRVD